MSTEPASPRPFLLGLAESSRGAARSSDVSGLFAEQLDSAARPTDTGRSEAAEPTRSSDDETPDVDSPSAERADESSNDQEEAVSREENAPAEESSESDNATEGEEVVAQVAVASTSDLAEAVPNTTVEFDPTGDGALAPQDAEIESAAPTEATGDFAPELAAAAEELPASTQLADGTLEIEGDAEGALAAEQSLTTDTTSQPTDAEAVTSGVTPEAAAQAGSDSGEQADSEAQSSAEPIEAEGTLSNPDGEGQTPEEQSPGDNAFSPIERVTAAASEETAEAAPEPALAEAPTSTTSTSTAADVADATPDPIGPTPPNADLVGVSVEGAEPTRPEALSTSEASRVERPPGVDPARFLTRVARAIDFANERGGGPIELRLSPPELGSLQVKIELREGVLTASLEAETPAARQTLLDNLPALRDRLEQQQIRIDKFDVDVRDDSGQRGGDYQPRDSDGRRSEGEGDRREPAPSRPRTTGAEEGAPTSEPARTIDFGDETINLVA